MMNKDSLAWIVSRGGIFTEGVKELDVLESFEFVDDIGRYLLDITIELDISSLERDIVDEEVLLSLLEVQVDEYVSREYGFEYRGGVATAVRAGSLLMLREVEFNPWIFVLHVLAEGLLALVIES
jgi:hypothetical protein